MKKWTMLLALLLATVFCFPGALAEQEAVESTGDNGGGQLVSHVYEPGDIASGLLAQAFGQEHGTMIVAEVRGEGIPLEAEMPDLVLRLGVAFSQGARLELGLRESQENVGFDIALDFREAYALVVDCLRPLGEDYQAVLRRALDDAGYDYVPVLTNDDVDAHNAHPGFKLGLGPSIQIAYGLPMIDALEAMLRRIRPYELEKGAADAAFDHALDEVIEGMERSGLRGQATGFKRALAIMGAVPYDRSNPHPTVLIVGEYLLNFHLGANHEIERYLEDNGLEVIEARMTDVIRKSYSYRHAQASEFHAGIPPRERAWNALVDDIFQATLALTDRLARGCPLYERPASMAELARRSDPIIHHTFDAGEGILIPAEILEQAARGVRNFVILQPFGCLPNHVVGRGLIHALKEQYPTAQFLPLDYDPDVSFANVENRLQMLIMNAKAQGCGEAHGETA